MIVDNSNDILIVKEGHFAFAIGEITSSTLQRSRLLSYAELELIEDAVEERRREFVAGRVLAKYAYTSLSDEDASLEKLSILRGEHGEPVLESHEGFVSISHHDGKVFIFASDEQIEVGVDIHKEETFGDEYELFLRESELEVLERNRGEMSLNSLINVAWTAKESFVKSHRRGLDYFERAMVEDVKQARDSYQVKFHGTSKITKVFPLKNYYLSVSSEHENIAEILGIFVTEI